MNGYWKYNKLYCVVTTLVILCLQVFNVQAGISSILLNIESGLMPTKQPSTEISNTVTDVPAMARIFYSAIGDLVEAVPIFPITFNVPDMVTAFGGLLSGMVGYITGSQGSGDSEPKDVLGLMANLYRTIAIQEDLHDIEFLT
ncbi:uncharacterized protein LOC126846539 [Adelges cooleyi]|uniref:uncharacterized protein LOC126846539 n=1 Tax=Adelges cooleyi TaxID=133065 RepID=UPI00217FC7C9|nr:uncharacterized protein LOC126846539 [Adelges cooleyi]